MHTKRTIIIGIVIVSVVGLVLRSSLGPLILILFGALIPPILLVGLLGGLAYGGYRYLAGRRSGSAPTNLPIMRSSTDPAAALAPTLATAFRRNNVPQLQRALAQLPPWPITQQIQQVVPDLVELKRSLYRAQAEGVPAALVERYLGNLTQAADAVWQLASNVDAVNQQQVAYRLVEPRLAQEAQQLQQLQHAMKASHDGIALLILSGTKRDTLQAVEDDLYALTTAVKRLENVHIQMAARP